MDDLNARAMARADPGLFLQIHRPPLQRGTGAVLCLSDDLGALDERPLIVPIGYV